MGFGGWGFPFATVERARVNEGSHMRGGLNPRNGRAPKSHTSGGKHDAWKMHYDCDNEDDLEEEELANADVKWKWELRL